jgi:mono/diheme cytochrome c family protein
MQAHATQYDRLVSRARLAVIPVVLFVGVSGGVFALAKLHLAKPGAPTAASVQLGNAGNGHVIYSRKCAACHGPDGRGGGIGPKLAGTPIPLAVAKAQIDAGGSVMPPGLVKGKEEQDVLAYLATILASK